MNSVAAVVMPSPSPIQQRMLELRLRAERAAVVPAGGPVRNSPLVDATRNPNAQINDPLAPVTVTPSLTDGIIIPDADDVTPVAPPVVHKYPPFESMSDAQKIVALKQFYDELQYSAHTQINNYDLYYQLFVLSVLDKVSALLAVQSVNSSVLRELPLSMTQANNLLGALSAAVLAQGVTPPDNWALGVQSVDDTEAGDDET